MFWHSSRFILVCVLLSGSVLGSESTAGSRIRSINDENAAVSYDTALGRWSLSTPRGTLIESAGAEVLFSGFKIRLQDVRNRSVWSGRFTDALGGGMEMRIDAVAERGVAVTQRIRLYRNPQFMTHEIRVRNGSGENLKILSIRQLTTGDDGGVFVSDAPERCSVLTNGYHHDPGTLFRCAEGCSASSWYNLAIHDPQSRGSFVVGAITNAVAENRFSVDRTATGSERKRAFRLDVVASYNEAYVRGDDTTGQYRPVLLRPGAEISSDVLFLQFSNDPFRSLEFFAESWAKSMGVMRKLALPSGWSSWEYYRFDINEEEVLKNADFIAEHLKPYGMDHVQLDEGYQRGYGDWAANDKFPHGLNWLARQIARRGLKPGIWLSPFVIDEASEIFRNHRDWLGRRQDSTVRLLRLAKGFGSVYTTKEGGIYGLDPTHSGAAQWLSDVFRRLAREDGFELFKIDFLYWTVLNMERYSNPTKSKAQAYTDGYRAIREAVGTTPFIIDCGALHAARYVDSWRINADVNARWSAYIRSRSVAGAVPNRSYLHRRLVYLDSDHLLVRPPIGEDEAQLRATLTAMSGSQVLSSDKLYDLPGERLEILKKVIPPFGVAAKPVDLFTRELPRLYVLPVARSFEKWYLLALFNWGEEPLHERLSLKELGLDVGRTQLVYDFWNERFIGVAEKLIDVTVRPRAVALLCIRKKTGVPQVVSTDRHVTQGGVDLQEVSWDNTRYVLKAVSNTVPGTAYVVTLYVPQGYRLTRVDCGGKCAVSYETAGEAVRVRFRCERGETAWEAGFSRIGL